MKNWIEIGESYFPNNFDTVFDVEPGTYQLTKRDDYGLGLQTINSKTDELYDLPSEEFQMFMKELDVFLDAKERYEKYKLTYKRGVMLHGSPGNGKTIMIELIARKIIAEGGIVILIQDISHINAFMAILNAIRAKSKDRMILVVMEEIDVIIESANRGERSSLLNMLDGGQGIANIVYLATTNYPEKLPENIYNRPSRFDLRIEVLPPNKEVIISYLTHVLHEDDLKDLDMDQLSDDLAGFSFASIKEFVIAYFVIGNQYGTILEKLESLKARPKVTNNNGATGFKAQYKDPKTKRKELPMITVGEVPVTV